MSKIVTMRDAREHLKKMREINNNKREARLKKAKSAPKKQAPKKEKEAK